MPIGLNAARALLATAGAGLAAGLGAPAWAIAACAGLAVVAPLPASMRPSAARGAPGETPSAPGPPPAALARGLVDSLPTALLIIAVNGRVVHANPAARAMLPRLSVGGHFAGLIRAPDFVAALGETLADRRERRVGFSANPGRERVLEARLASLPPDGAFGPEASVIVQLEDRTEARRADEMRSDFIANASHELRTPLASIIGYIETLQHHAREDSEARERFLEIMAREAGRMQRLVDDLMSLSRIELNEHLRPGETCAVTDIAAESASALLPIAEASGVRLEIEVPEESPLVPGDRDQLYQVFLNLIDNAIKYAGRGAVVRVRQAGPSRAFPGRIGVAVEDTGPGIPRQHLPRLTERFYRVNAGHSRTKGGTGLGLAIVKHILNRHEGKLEIVSTEGVGSRFTVWLPRGGAPDVAEGPGEAEGIVAAGAREPLRSSG